MKKASLVILVIVSLIGIFSIFSSKAQTPVQVGDQVPSFKLQDQNGDLFDLSAFKGNTAMVIYFYPKDDTPGCTKEACSFRDSYETFTDKDIKVIGISSDDVESHKNFAEKYNLPFTLLADTENRVRDLFGVKANAFGLIPGRVTYVIDKEGEVIFMYQSQFQAKKHIKEALKAINSSL